jgi:hypothetical protein
VTKRLLSACLLLVAFAGSLCATSTTVYVGTSRYDFASWSTGAIFSLSVDYLGSSDYQITYTADFTDPNWVGPSYITGIEFRFGMTNAISAAFAGSPSGNWAVYPNTMALSGGTLGTGNCQSDSTSSFVCADDNQAANPTPGANPTVGHVYSWVINATYAEPLTFNDVQIGALFMNCDPDSSGGCTWNSQARPLIDLPAGSTPVPELPEVHLVVIGLMGLLVLSFRFNFPFRRSISRVTKRSSVHMVRGSTAMSGGPE